MSKMQKSFTFMLAIVALILIGLQQTDNIAETKMTVRYNSEEPTYKSEKMITLAYEPTGMLGYKLIADEVEHFAEMKYTWFTSPLVTLFSKGAEPSWTIKADRAKLTNSRQLYLYGNIEVNNLEENPQIKQIVTDSAYVDLVTQNISSDSEVTLLGPFFSSEGLKMKGNLREKTANLIEKVTTKYTPQN